MGCQTNQNFDIQGHRGCRGLLPENTIPAFLEATELGVNTLELDVVISKDLKVVVSHEPWMSSDICYDPQGKTISKENEKEHNIYTMNYDSIKMYNCGSKRLPKFPNQSLLKISKPLLSDVIETIEDYCTNRNKPLIHYNIEIKRNPNSDHTFHPSFSVFSDLVMSEIGKYNINDRTIVQSFDIETLQYVNRKYPIQKLAYLNYAEQSDDLLFKKLGFLPEIYSPYFKLVNENTVNYCHNNNVLVIPWTVNEEKDMLSLIKMNVDGIITDYPNILLDINGIK